MSYKEASRVHTSVLADAEKRLLVWMAARLPAWVNSDHLTVLAGVSMAGAGACYWAGTPAALLGAILFVALNWFGDSLDGTLARVRRHERPRYGFYVDHVLDVVGILLLVAGLVLGGHVSGAAGSAFLLAYYLLMIEIALATHAVGTFRISYWKFGPTELRILLAIGTLQLLRSSFVTIAGHRMLLFDIGMIIGATAIVITFISSVVSNTRALYRAEPLPSKSQGSGLKAQGLGLRAQGLGLRAQGEGLRDKGDKGSGTRAQEHAWGYTATHSTQSLRPAPSLSPEP